VQLRRPTRPPQPRLRKVADLRCGAVRRVPVCNRNDRLRTSADRQWCWRSTGNAFKKDTVSIKDFSNCSILHTSGENLSTGQTSLARKEVRVAGSPGAALECSVPIRPTFPFFNQEGKYEN
jgi:hypothetical protein